MTQERFPIVAPETVGIDPERLAALIQRASREVDEGLLPSAQIAIARHGQLVAMHTFGQAQFQGKTAPATNDTLYCVFSATKAITSAAAWMLIEEGRLDIDQPVANLIPEFHPYRRISQRALSAQCISRPGKTSRVLSSLEIGVGARVALYLPSIVEHVCGGGSD